MTQRWSPYPDLTLCGGLALWLMAAQGAVAEVIDLGAGAEDLRVRDLPLNVHPAATGAGS